jgi:glycine/serine hydroxymethyltransferase
MRGMDEDDFRTIGRVMAEALGDSADLDGLRTQIERLCAEHPLYPGFRGWTTYVT